MSDPQFLAYDVGMNNGDDTEYYLKKGYKVIAIEANTALCNDCKTRFQDDIAQGNLVILNIGVGQSEGILDFYLDTHHDTTSTFVPQPNEDGRYKVIPIEVKKLSAVIKEYGFPHFLKIDIEGLDFEVLEELYRAGICPPFLSAEAHTVDVFCMLVCMGYDQFKVIESGKVHETFKDHLIQTFDGRTVPHQFEHNSSGPYGDDFPSSWQHKTDAILRLASLETTWRDVHAKSTRQVYLHQARVDQAANPEEEIELAYSYWRRYPDVARDGRYGEFGSLGWQGALRHYEEHGRHENRRRWKA